VVLLEAEGSMRNSRIYKGCCKLHLDAILRLMSLVT